MTNENKPKIIWLHSHFLYWMGGTKFIFEIIKKLRSSFDIVVIVEKSSKLALDNYKSQNVKFVSLNKTTSTSPFYWMTLPLQIYINYAKIKRVVEKQKPQVIVTSMFPMNIFPLLFKTPGVQYCFEPFAFFHDPEFTKGFGLPKRIFIKILSFIYKNLDIKLARKSSILITLNQTTAKSIEEIYKRKPVISYAGIDSKHFKKFISTNIYEKYKDYEIIVHSTDYTPVKRTDAMIKIFSKVNRKHPKTKLLITSTIPNLKEVAKLKSLARRLSVLKSIEFLGFVEYATLPQIYSIAKVLVQTSYSENSGTTSMALPVKEALACGTPCVRFPIKNEDVVDNQTGYLVDPRDEQAMVKAIIKILEWPDEKFRSASFIGRQTILNKYTWRKTSDIVKRAISSIIH